MDSPAPTTRSTPVSVLQCRRYVGWSAIASGAAFIIVGEKPYFPSSWSLVLLMASLALYLGMIPIARWIANGVEVHVTGDGAQITRAAEIAGVMGAGVAAATAILALPHWLPAVAAQILDTSSLGVIGAWVLVSNGLAFHSRLFNLVLAVLGVLAGLGWLLAALMMWIELITDGMGSLVAALENLRILTGYVGSAFYVLWALWLGIWLLVRKR